MKFPSDNIMIYHKNKQIIGNYKILYHFSLHLLAIWYEPKTTNTGCWGWPYQPALNGPHSSLNHIWFRCGVTDFSRWSLIANRMAAFVWSLNWRSRAVFVLGTDRGRGRQMGAPYTQIATMKGLGRTFQRPPSLRYEIQLKRLYVKSTSNKSI